MDLEKVLKEEMDRLNLQNLRKTDFAGAQNVMVVVSRGLPVKGTEAAFRRIPYLQPILDGRFSQKKDEDGNIIIDVDPDSFYSCMAFAESSFKQPTLLLTTLSKKKNGVEDLISTADYIGIDIPYISTLDELLELEKALRDVKGETFVKIYRKTYEPSGEIPDRMGARDAAATLCFSIAKQTLPISSNNKIHQKVVTDTLFILSHARTFGPRLRTHVWAEFQKVVTLTDKQRNKQFGQWISKDALEFDFYRSESDSGTEYACPAWPS